MSIITFNALGWSNLICLFYGAADNIRGWSFEGLCALRARVPPRGTVAVAGHTTPGLRSCRRLTGAAYASAPRGCPCCMLYIYSDYREEQHAVKLGVSARGEPLGRIDLSLDFATWQTIVRFVAFYHSLLSERSFSSMLQSK